MQCFIKYYKCILEESYFYENDLKHIDFTNSQLSGINFTQTKLNKIDLSETHFTHLTVGLADLKGCIVNEIQAVNLSSLLGLVIKRSEERRVGKEWRCLWWESDCRRMRYKK